MRSLDKGDEIMSGMTAFAWRERLQAAHFTAIGAIERGLFGWFDKKVKAYRNLPVNEQAEVVSLVGEIGLVNGAPAVHIHVVVILADGTARGGHLLRADVWPTLEVFLTDYPGAAVERARRGDGSLPVPTGGARMMWNDRYAIHVIAYVLFGPAAGCR
jgi:uncharacterized protein